MTYTKLLLGTMISSLALTASGAYAADLGGNCCADLEERVAELEATTVRKGNNKVSVKLYGQVNKALLFWDDGAESDVFVVDNDNSGTRIGLSGEAKISPGWSAGFNIEWDFQNDASDKVSNNVDDFSDEQGIRFADVWIKGSIGKVTLGQGSFASDGVSEVDLSGTSVASFSYLGIGNAFRFNGTGPKISDVYNNLDGQGRGSRIRYDTPEFAGFIVSASFGEDDAWDVALRFKQKLGDFQLAAAVAYSESDDEATLAKGTTERVNGSVSVSHAPTGLSLTFAAGDDENNLVNEQFFWYAKVGITQKWTDLGATSISADYGNGDDFGSILVGGTPYDADYNRYGVQIVQNIDAAAMEIYAAWQHNELEAGPAAYDDIDLFMVGSRIKF